VSILFLVGLTGAGKSTVLPTLRAGAGDALLPDRRELTERVMIPAALLLDGHEAREVGDRLERFRLTARYREANPDGIVHALAEHLAGGVLQGRAVFDGLRGLPEVVAADRRFPGSRFLMLEALPETRIHRIAGRADAFDKVAVPAGGSGEALAQGGSIASGAAAGGGGRAPEDRAGERTADLARARRIVDEEQRHYDQAGARRYLEGLPPTRRLIVDTDSIGADEVAALVAEWL
jgi:hypothetical protein